MVTEKRSRRELAVWLLKKSCEVKLFAPFGRRLHGW